MKRFLTYIAEGALYKKWALAWWLHGSWAAAWIAGDLKKANAIRDLIKSDLFKKERALIKEAYDKGGQEEHRL